MNIKKIVPLSILVSSVSLFVFGNVPIRQRPSNKENLTQEQLNAAWKKTRVDVPLSFDRPPKATEGDIKGTVPTQQYNLFRDVESAHEEGRDLPRALLFIGPRGVGKTLTVRALSSALKGRSVHFMAADIFKLTEKGSTAAKGVRDIYRRARNHVKNTGQWVIIFIDDIHYLHCVGKGQTSSMENVITELSSEMDPLRNNNEKILLIVATNQKVDAIDEFFTMSDHFNTVDFPLPNEENRLAILNYYFSICGRRIKEGVTFNRMAKSTEGFSVRTLIRLVLNTKRNAKRECEAIDYKHMSEALLKEGKKLPWSNWDKAAYVVETTSKGTAGGSVIGTVASPGPGTIVGAGVGALGGFVFGLCIALENS